MESDRLVAARPLRRTPGYRVRQVTNRLFSGCSKTSVVVDASTGKVVASIPNGTRVDALALGSVEKADLHSEWRGNVTVVHQDSADKYTAVATVPTFSGAKTITVDPTTHNAYLFVWKTATRCSI